MDFKEAFTKKLNLGKYASIALFNTNEHSQELQQLTSESALAELGKAYDVVFVHAFTAQEMKDYLHQFSEANLIAVGGLCYLVYPKLKNGIYEGVHRDAIFPALEVDDALGYLPGTNYKFNKMVGLNDVFTIIGIKHMTDKEKAKAVSGEASSKPSGRVADYEQFIPDLSAKLGDLAAAFDALTPGKKRDWARNIYSAKTEPTRQKRFEKLVDELTVK